MKLSCNVKVYVFQMQIKHCYWILHRTRTCHASGWLTTSLRRKVSFIPSDKRENEELLATIRMREKDLKCLDREIEGEEKQRRSDVPSFSMDDMVMDYSRISR